MKKKQDKKIINRKAKIEQCMKPCIRNELSQNSEKPPPLGGG